MGLPTVAMGLLGLLMPPRSAAGASLAAHQSLAVTGRPGAGADCTPSLAYDDRDYYWHVGRILTADRPQSSVVGAGAWRRIDSLCRVCALQSAVSGFRPRGEWLSPLMGGLTGVITGATGVFVIPAVPATGAGLSSRRAGAGQGCRSPFPPALAAGLALHDGWHDDAWLLSALALLPALLGMWLGQRIRSRLARSAFVRAFCCSCWRWG